MIRSGLTITLISLLISTVLITLESIHGVPKPLTHYSTKLTVYIILGLIGLYGLFVKLIPGVSRLTEVYPGYASSSSLIKVGLGFGGALAFLGTPPTLTWGLLGLGIVFVASIMLLFGLIGLGKLCVQIGRREKDLILPSSGILVIQLQLATIVWAIAYVYLKKLAGASWILMLTQSSSISWTIVYTMMKEKFSEYVAGLTLEYPYLTWITIYSVSCLIMILGFTRLIKKRSL